MENIKFKTGTKLVQFAECPASIWKYRTSDGKLVNIYNTEVENYCVAVYDNGNVIVGGDNWAGGAAGCIKLHTWLFTKNLHLIDAYNIYRRNYGVCVDNKGFWYISAQMIADGTVFKLTESGHVVWMYDPAAGANPGAFKAIAVDSDGDVIGVNGNVRNENILKLNGFDGTKDWLYDTNKDMNGVAIDSNDDICAVGGRNVGIPASVWKVSSAGILQWVYDTTTIARAVAVDINDDFYVVGDEAGNVSGRKLKGSDGTHLKSYALGANIKGYGVTVAKPGIKIIEGTPTAAGTGYKINDILDVDEGNGGQVKVLTVSDTGAVLTLETTPYKEGSNYTTGAGKTTTGNNGTGCTIEIAIVTDIFVYIVGQTNASGQNVWKFKNADGVNPVWAVNTGGDPARGVALDLNGEYLYVVGAEATPPP